MNIAFDDCVFSCVVFHVFILIRNEYNGVMKDRLLNHLVSFRYGNLTLYGEVLYVLENEEGAVYVS